jgi:predicted permease
MESIAREFRQVSRRLARSPSFTLVALFTLALGIGANTAIFAVVNSVLIRPLPYPEQERLVVPHFTAPGMGIQDVPYSESAYLINADESRVFELIGVYRQAALNLTGGTEPERVPAVEATHEVLSILGAAPVLGRLTVLEDDLPGSPEVAMLSYGLWQRRFGGDPSVVGRTMEVNGVSREVVGVLPESFRFLTREADLFFPARFDRADPDEGSFNYTGIARVRSGVSGAAVTADMERLIALWPERYSGLITQAMLDQIGMAPNVIPLKEQLTGDVSRALWILLVAVGLVLLIACSNVANLFLVRAEGRQREVAVRTAMGASAGDLVRYFLVESLALGILGGTVGLFLAWAGTRALKSFGPENLPRLSEIGLDPTTLLFTLGASLLAGLLFGLFPVLKYRKPDMSAGLKEGGRGGSVGRERHRARNTLVVFQMALALVLLVGSGLMVRSFQALRTVDPGFDPRGTLTLRVTLPASTYPTSGSRLAFHDQLLGTIDGLPGVVSAGAADNIPMGGGLSNSGTWFEDYPTLPDQVPDVIETSRVTANYLETLRVGLLEGRTLTPFDARDRTEVVVVNRALAEKYWPGQSALGKRLTQDLDLDSGASADTRWKTVVGVVEDVRSLAMEIDPNPALFFPLVEAVDEEESRTPQSMAYVIRTSGEPTALLPAVRQAVWALDPNLPIADIRTLESVVRDSMARTAFTMVLLGIAALVALFLGTVGIYGVISYAVTQRTREMGIRLALGAEGAAVTGMVLRQGAVLAGVGIAIGLAGALGLTRLMEALLFGVSAMDPVTFFGVPLVLGAVALLASWLPARRAARTDPVEALRAE